MKLPAGLWKRLRDAVDPAKHRPRLAPGVELITFDGYSMVAAPHGLLHLRLVPAEARLLRLMDGSRSVKEIVVDHLGNSGGLDLARVADLVHELNTGSFLDPAFVDVYGAIRRAIGRPDRIGSRIRRIVRTQSVGWNGADRAVRWLYRHGIRFMFTAPAQIVCAALALGGLAAFGAVLHARTFSLAGRSIAFEGLVLVLLSLLVVAVHELGHASVLVHYGRRVGAAGFLIYFGAPAVYVDSSDAQMLGRRKRILQSFAGPYADLVLAGATALLMWAWPGAAFSPLLYRFAVLDYVAIFLNLVPLLELDGYWILSDLGGIPDLRPRSLSFLRRDLWTKLRARDRFSRREIAFAVYGVLGVAFAVFSYYVAIFFWRRVFAVLATRMWREGVAGRVTLVILGLFVVAPLAREAVALVRAAAVRMRTAASAARFRLQRHWRIDAGRLIDALPLFDGLSDDVLGELAGRVRIRRFPRGRVVVRQGDRASAFYVVRRGTFDVVEEDREATSERRLARLGRGESFGEIGLVDAAPRAAMVRAAEQGELFEIDKGTFDRLLADRAHVTRFPPTLAAASELRGFRCFASLQSHEIAWLLEHGIWSEFHPGTEIVTQGDVGDAFYAIGSGHADVLVDGRTDGELGPGSFFGERALLLDAPRMATVRASTLVRAFRLDREGFDRLVARAFRRGRLQSHWTAAPQRRIIW